MLYLARFMRFLSSGLRIYFLLSNIFRIMDGGFFCGRSLFKKYPNNILFGGYFKNEKTYNKRKFQFRDNIITISAVIV